MFFRYGTSVLCATSSFHSRTSFESMWRFMGQSRPKDNCSAGKPDLKLDKMETIDFHIRCCLSWFSSPALLQEHASKCSAKTENRLNSGKKEDQLQLTIVEPVQSFNEPTDEEIIPVHLI